MVEPYSIPDDLDRRWAEFVNCSKRSNTMRRFLRQQIAPIADCVALDAAMGIGCDVAFLAKTCKSVVGNEINDQLRSLALRRVGEQSNVRFTSFLWQQLFSKFGGNSFDLALLLGNSFCLVSEDLTKKTIAENLRKVVKPGGKLIVDERNFAYLLHDREKILRSGFRYAGKTIYCGKRIKGSPIFISNSKVDFAYEDTQTGKIIGFRTMYPLLMDELRELFLCSGFTKVEVFSDLEKGLRDDADFYTYVFR